MKAIQLLDYGFENLRYADAPTPQAGPGEVLLRLAAASVNQIDAGKASGAMRQFMPLTFPWIPGGDFAGTVEAVGAGVTGFEPGAEVYGTVAAGANTPGYGGAYAQYLAVPASAIAAKPASLTLTEAAAVPVAALTAWQALGSVAGLQAGQRILVHAGAGAVGAFAVQLAHQRGAYVIATAAAEDLDFVRFLGADEVLDYQATRFEEAVKAVDVVLDLVGGDTQARSYQVLQPGGLLVASNQPPSPDEAARHQVRAAMVLMQPSATDLAHLAQLFDAGRLRADLARTYPLEQAGLAWQDMARHSPQRGNAPAPAVAAPKKHGKIVLTIN
ncbi:NADP-dependent oxidoreductase [Hymenobacter sp. RP-2-7]|uniref:NADP-dependent oxidoreductase n=1 Tax=Hymenobacter polaris TaxID=2682546 RepID=A0A7Y0AAJ2_9BACT|nr:NADP-dependent oxidoreductase [Hymenobacter polaris]NML63617.1 NADP-dependent oxidoreductase [Hymenobacter polaris]